MPRRRGCALICLVLAACGPRGDTESPDPETSLAWLEGTWESVSGTSRNVETWEVTPGGLRGSNVTWDQGVEVHREALQVREEAGAVIYRAAPQGQTANDFTLVHSRRRTASFEDPGHDWPQRIRYARDGDVLRAVVSGLAEGSRTVTWTWHRTR